MRKLLLSLIALVLAGLSAPALQANEGWYVGIGVGSTDQKDACDISDPPFLIFTGSCDDTDTGVKIFGGRQFTERLGLEFGYVDLGKTEASGTVTIPPGGPVPATLEAEAKGFYAAGTGTLPIGAAQKFGLLGKIGVIASDVEVDVNIPGESGDDTDVDAMLGFGVKYDFSDRLGIRAEWERFFAVGDEDETGESDIDLVTIGIVFWF